MSEWISVKDRMEKCEGCPFEHTGENYLDNFCIVQESVRLWEEYIEVMQKVMVE